MPEVVATLDTDAEPGEKFSPQVRAEIAEVAPSTLNDGAVTTPKVADEAITNPKLAPGAVHSENIAAGEVKADNLAAGAVGTAALDDGSVTDTKAGPGVMTTHDDEGNAITLGVVLISDADYAALGAPDPNTLYFTTG